MFRFPLLSPFGVHTIARECVIEIASSTEVSREEAAGKEELKERGVRFREKKFRGDNLCWLSPLSLGILVVKKDSNLFLFPLLKLVMVPTDTEGQLALCDKLRAGVIAVRSAVNDLVFPSFFHF